MQKNNELTLENLNVAVRQVRESEAKELGVSVDELDCEIAIRQGPQAWFERTGETITVEEFRERLAQSFVAMRTMLGL